MKDLSLPDQIDLIGTILSRNSISPRRLALPGPNRGQILKMIAAACAAPDHRRLQPWRFICIANDNRDGLADLFEAAARETHGTMTAAETQRAREKAQYGATLIAVVAEIKTDLADVPPHEQWVSVGAAVQNILLAAQALGFGAMIVSGDKVRTKALRAGLGLSDSEALVGFVAMGTPTKPARDKARPDPKTVMSDWPENTLPNHGAVK